MDWLIKSSKFMKVIWYYIFLIVPSCSDNHSMCSVMSDDDDAPLGQSNYNAAAVTSWLDGLQSQPSGPVASKTSDLDKVNVIFSF